MRPTPEIAQLPSNALHRGPAHCLDNKIIMVWCGAEHTDMTGVPWREVAIDGMAEHEAMLKNTRHTKIMIAT